MKARVINRARAGDSHNVVTVESEGENHRYRRAPCAECPWRRDAKVGAFPAEAFRLSARTAYDMGKSSFACHMVPKSQPATCAGFLLRGATHSQQVRIAQAMGRLDLSKVKSDVALYDSYRAMAEANGVDPQDPVLQPCRSDHE